MSANTSEKKKKYRGQNGNFNQCLLIVCRLIFNDFYSNKTVCFCNPAFSNLPECPMAKDVFDNVSAKKKDTSN